MTVYHLFDNLTAVQPAPGTAAPPQAGQPSSPDAYNLPSGSKAAFIPGGGAGVLQNQNGQTFQVNVVSATNPGVSVSATVQPIFSNDGVYWTTAGVAAITVASGASPQIGYATQTAAWAFTSAYLTAVSANTKVSCLLNC